MGIGCVIGMNGGSRPGPCAYLIGRAHVVTVGQKNAADSLTGQLVEDLSGGLDRIDAEVAPWVTDQPAIKVVAVGL